MLLRPPWWSSSSTIIFRDESAQANNKSRYYFEPGTTCLVVVRRTLIARDEKRFSFFSISFSTHVMCANLSKSRSHGSAALWQVARDSKWMCARLWYRYFWAFSFSTHNLKPFAISRASAYNSYTQFFRVELNFIVSQLYFPHGCSSHFIDWTMMASRSWEMCAAAMPLQARDLDVLEKSEISKKMKPFELSKTAKKAEQEL